MGIARRISDRLTRKVCANWLSRLTRSTRPSLRPPAMPVQPIARALPQPRPRPDLRLICRPAFLKWLQLAEQNLAETRRAALPALLRIRMRVPQLTGPLQQIAPTPSARR